MSTSTLESPETRRALNAFAAREAEWQRGEEGARQEIAAAFALVRSVPPQHVALPCVELKNGGLRVRSVSLAEAVRDLTMEGHGSEQLLAVLQGSDCPLVQKLRDALCAEYQRRNANDIAEARS